MPPDCAVFFDRDGVLNEAVVIRGRPYPPADSESLRIAHGALEAVQALRLAGFKIICVTNQPDIARGTRTVENVDLMNKKVFEALQLDDLLTCPHDNADNCACRKPKPGMLLEACVRWNLDIKRSYLIGDRRSDMEAGARAGCATIFLDYGYAELPPTLENVSFTCQTLQEATAWILNKHGA